MDIIQDYFGAYIMGSVLTNLIKSSLFTNMTG